MLKYKLYNVTYYNSRQICNVGSKWHVEQFSSLQMNECMRCPCWEVFGTAASTVRAPCFPDGCVCTENPLRSFVRAGP